MPAPALRFSRTPAVMIVQADGGAGPASSGNVSNLLPRHE
jgi:hypothetical protein